MHLQAKEAIKSLLRECVESTRGVSPGCHLRMLCDLALQLDELLPECDEQYGPGGWDGDKLVKTLDTKVRTVASEILRFRPSGIWVPFCQASRCGLSAHPLSLPCALSLQAHAFLDQAGDHPIPSGVLARVAEVFRTEIDEWGGGWKSATIHWVRACLVVTQRGLVQTGD